MTLQGSSRKLTIGADCHTSDYWLCQLDLDYLDAGEWDMYTDTSSCFSPQCLFITVMRLMPMGRRFRRLHCLLLAGVLWASRTETRLVMIALWACALCHTVWCCARPVYIHTHSHTYTHNHIPWLLVLARVHG